MAKCPHYSPAGCKGTDDTPLLEQIAALAAELEAVKAEYAEFVKQHEREVRAAEAKLAGGEAALKEAWALGRRSYCPAGVLADEARTEREWQAARAALTHPTPTHEDGSGERLTPEQVADHIGVTPYSDMRPFVVQAVRYTREQDALSHTSGEVTEAMVRAASVAMNVGFRDFHVPEHVIRRTLEAALRGEAS